MYCRSSSLSTAAGLLLRAGDQQQLEQLADGVKELLTSSTWEHKIGGLMAARVSKAYQQQYITS